MPLTPLPVPQRSPRRLVATLVAALLVAAAALVPTASAAAAEIPGAVSSVTTDKTSYGYNERIKLSFTWAAPDAAVAGDTFALDLPDELKATSLATFPLLAADGSVVAWGAWAGKTVRITLTDYVDTHDGVGGNGFITVQWDHTFTPVTSQPIVLDFGSNAVEVVIGDKPAPEVPCTDNCPTPKPPATSRNLSKRGSWGDGAYEGTRDATGNISWTVRLPGNDGGFAGPITITDAPAAGSIAECSTVAVITQQTLVSGAVKSPVDPTRFELTCAPEGFTLVLDVIAPQEFVTITYRGTITNQVSGVYSNAVRVEIPGAADAMQETVMRRTAAGGDGGGTQSVSVGDVVWHDLDRDGVQDAGEPGIPGVVLKLTGPSGAVTAIDGTPVAAVTTDADGRYRFDRLPVLAEGQHYTVTIDAEASAEALVDLSPTVAEAGGDRATDSATGSADSGALVTNGASDLTLDFGFVTSALPTLPQPETPEPQTPELPTLGADATEQLAYTGGQPVWPLAVIAGMLALLGVSLLGVSLLGASLTVGRRIQRG
jgi:hypothetical protein